jgi:hypothetical protein
MSSTDDNTPQTDRSQWPFRKLKRTEQGLPDRMADPDAAIDCMWQLAVDAWAMRGEDVREFRLPRHVVRIIRGRR